MNGEFKDTTKIIRKRKGTTVVNKEKNCIPKFDNPHNPNGRRGNSGNGSASPYQEPNYEKTKQRRKYAIEEMANNTFDTEHSCFLTKIPTCTQHLKRTLFRAYFREKYVI